MTIRPARRADLRAMAEVMAAAFHDEELFGALMHPRRDAYPEDFVAFFERRVRAHWREAPRRTLLVGEDPASGRVVAVADWERQGAGQTTTGRKGTGTGTGGGGGFGGLDPQNLVSAVAAYSERLTTYLWPNRAADPSKATVLEEAAPLFAHHWATPARQENWYLDMLAVHPDHQRRHHGRALVQWGLDAARADGVVASVIAAHGKERFYARCGFVEVGRANVGPLAENGIRGGAIMFTGVEEREAGVGVGVGVGEGEGEGEGDGEGEAV